MEQQAHETLYVEVSATSSTAQEDYATTTQAVHQHRSAWS
jgi:hypothetical protein